MTNTSPAPLATRSLPWFTLLALAVGAAPFAVGNNELTHPTLLLAALFGLALVAVVLRVLPLFRSAARWRWVSEIAAQLIYVMLLGVASGGLHSTFLTLFLLPLTAAALALPRLAYGVAAAVVVLAYVVLGGMTPDVDIASSTFVILLIGRLSPILVATAAIAVLMSHMQVAERQIRDLSASDALTGLYNARAFDQHLTSEHRKAERMGRPYSVAIIDLDNLTQVSESAGTEAANQMILAVSTAMQRSIRATDIAARLGGNEFAVLLMQADPTTAATIGQRIRNHVYAGTISAGNRLLRANVSLGIASFPRDHLSAKDVLAAAEQRMQQDRQARATPAVR